MNLLIKLLKKLGWLLLFILLLVLVMAALMVWDGHQLERELQRIAASFMVGSSPFIIPLPADRIVIVTVDRTDSALTCAAINIKQGVVRTAHFSAATLPLEFERGIDVSGAASALANCDRVHVTLLAHLSFFKGEISIHYAEAAITQIGVPRLWD